MSYGQNVFDMWYRDMDMDEILSGLFEQISERSKQKKDDKKEEEQPTDDVPATTGLEPEATASKPVVCKSPNASTMFEVAKASYMKPKERPQLINQWWRRVQGFQTPTFTAYYDETNDVYILGYRGTVTQSLPDLTADRRIAFNQLAQSDRYKKDLQTTQKFLERNGRDQCYFTVGHSLGNAIQLQIQRDLEYFAKGGRGFNGALQPKDLIKRPKGFEFWFIKGDPLYSLMGRRLKKRLFVFPQKSKKALENHALDNFKGLKKAQAINKPRGGSRKPNLNDLSKLGFISKEDKKKIDPWELDKMFRDK